MNNKKPFVKTQVKKENAHFINNDIKSLEVRLIGDNIPNTGTIYKYREAQNLANSLDLDLVVVSPNADPPVAKIVNYSKFMYEEEKKVKELAKKQKENNKPLKEIQLTPNIGKADIENKSKFLKEFLEKGHKVKIIMKFKGREIDTCASKGELILLEMIDNNSLLAKVDNLPKMFGKQMVINLTPKK